MTTTKLYKNELLKKSDIENLRKLAVIVKQLEDLPLQEMKTLADVEMTRRAWCVFGDDRGDNYITRAVLNLEKAINTLVQCTDEKLLTKMEAEHEIAV